MHQSWKPGDPIPRFKPVKDMDSLLRDVLKDNEIISKDSRDFPSPSRLETEAQKILSDFYEKQAAKAKTWQSYNQDITIDENNILPVGFVKGYDAGKNSEIIQTLDQTTIFPHFCCSLYGPPGNDSNDSSGVETPAIYYSSQYNNIGTDCFVKSWDNFMMFLGRSTKIMDDLQMLVTSAKKEGLRTGNDMITDLFYLAVDGLKNVKEDYIQGTEKIRSIYADLGDRRDFPSFVLKSAEIITSILLSPETQKRIQASNKRGLVPVCQMHFGLGGYHRMLKRDYGWNESTCPKAKYMGLKHPIFAVTPPIYAHEGGAFYDSQTNMIIGKRKQIVEFLMFLNKLWVLDENDLKYLV